MIYKIVTVDQENKTITVEAGATWKQIQELIDPLDLSVQNIQSYNDFSVDGSIGVNCHGREINGSLETAIISLEVMLSDGRLVTASPHQNCDLFYNVIGGYGLLGIITKATLQLTKNHLLKKEWSLIPHRYKEYFEHCIKNNRNTIFHSGILWLTTQDSLITSTTFFTTS